MKTLKIATRAPRLPMQTKIVGPIMVHKASTVTIIQERARAAA